MRAVCRVVDAIVQLYWLKIEWVDAFKAANVVAVLVRERAALMMGVDATVGAEIVLGNFRVELIELQFALRNLHASSTPLQSARVWLQCGLSRRRESFRLRSGSNPRRRESPGGLPEMKRWRGLLLSPHQE